MRGWVARITERTFLYFAGEAAAYTRSFTAQDPAQMS